MDMPISPATFAVAEQIAPISLQIWDAKYRLKDAGGGPIDLSIEESWRRVARALAEIEAEPSRWEPLFYTAFADFRFLPAGRILSGAGSDRRVTLFNCFVMGDIGMIAAQGCHHGPPPCAGGHYGPAHRVPDIHERKRAGCISPHAAHRGSFWAKRGEIIPDAPALLHR